MASRDDALIPVFIPALVALLLRAERDKGTALTAEEVMAMRDRGNCIMMTRSQAQELAESRGYDDLDPERCWEQWQVAREGLAKS